MTLFWPDIHPTFQETLNPDRIRPAGCVALACKVSEGVGWTRPGYRRFSDAAQELGLGFTAYHFLRSERNGAAQAQWTREAMGTDWPRVPVMLDWEVSIDNTWPEAPVARSYINEIHRLGGRVGSNYIPRWYWSRIGSPDLREPPFGAIPIIQSSYGTNPRGSIADTYPGDFSSRWAGYGARTVTALQWGSRVHISGYPGDLDMNAYRGTMTQLRSSGMFHWSTEETDMALATQNVTVPAIPTNPPTPQPQTDRRADVALGHALAQAGTAHIKVEALRGEVTNGFDAVFQDLELLRQNLSAIGADVAELLRLVRDVGGGNPDTATIVTAIRQAATEVTSLVPNGVKVALREGTVEP